MKRLFKTSLLAVALLASISANTQEKATQFGVKGGINLSNLSGDIVGNKAKVGFNVGVTLDQAITESFYVQTGLDLTSKGAKITQGGINYTINLLYLQLPIHAAYKVAVSEGAKIVFHAGPYIAYGVGGKYSGDLGDSGIIGASLGFDSFQKGLFKSFDLGIGGGVGVEFGQIGVNLGYDLGLVNIWDNVGGSIKNQNAHLSLGYRF